MKSFKLRTPTEAGAIKVRLRDPTGRTLDWLATPFDTDQELQNMSAGEYTALLEPLGQPPVAFSFSIRSSDDDEGKVIQVPQLTELRSQGGIIGPIRGEAHIRQQQQQQKKKPEQQEEEREQPPPESVAPLLVSTLGESDLPNALDLAALTRRITIGLSENVPYQRGHWKPYGGSAAHVEVTSSGVDIKINRTECDLPKAPRVRMSISLARSKVERILIPLYLGGVVATARASSLTTADLIIKVLPLDPGRRALVQALEAGTAADISSFQDAFDTSDLAASLASPNAALQDPWTAIVVELLAQRFSNFKPPSKVVWREFAQGQHGWIADVNVLAAREILSLGAIMLEPERVAAAEEALHALTRARKAGAPYFAYTNNLLGEMLGALASGAPTRKQRRWAEREQNSLRRAISVRGNLGATFSWMMSISARSFNENKRAPQVFAPARGDLSARFSRKLFEGEVMLAGIRPRPTKRVWAAKRAGVRLESIDVPKKRALQFDIGQNSPSASRGSMTPSIDPNKGRFGGKAERKGFTLSVQFGTEGPNFVEFTLLIDAPHGGVIPYSDTVEFFLHDSFEPDHVRVMFRGQRAQLPLAAYGGFTVGAKLTRQGIKLELDLAEVPDAPRRIRIY